jgi:hypothetical protein
MTLLEEHKATAIPSLPAVTNVRFSPPEQHMGLSNTYCVVYGMLLALW